MYAYIKGEITYKSPTLVYIETGGVGYAINISLYTFTQIENEEKTRLLTHLIVREDEMTLYGFSSDKERTLFTKLIQVSGIGPNTARVILSSLNPDEVVSAIVSEDADTFKRVKGIGPKTAQRVILDLKDKIDLSYTTDGKSALQSGQDKPNANLEATQALQALGFQRNRIIKVLNQITKEAESPMNTESLVKLALQRLS